MKSHRRYRIAAAAVLSCGLGINSLAEARNRPRAKPFVSNKIFGMGVMVGVPHAVCGKYYLGRDTAIDFGIGRYYRWRRHDGLHIHADMLWHPANLAQTRQFHLPLYVGVGARLLDHNDGPDDHTHVGVRVPIGVAIDFENIPLDVFLEFAVDADFLGHHYIDFNGALGARYYFM